MDQWKMAYKGKIWFKEDKIFISRLVDPENLFLPPLIIKLGFDKSLDKSGECFQTFNNVFPHLWGEKIKERSALDVSNLSLMEDRQRKQSKQKNKNYEFI